MVSLKLNRTIFLIRIRRLILYFRMEIVPVEVKGGEDKSAPSFKKYVQEKEPKTALRFLKRGYRKDGNVTNVPLYLARKIRELM